MGRDRSAAKGMELRSEEHTSELQSHSDLVCRLLLEKKKERDYFFDFFASVSISVIIKVIEGVIDLDKTNIPSEPLRWSALAAERETGINRATIQKRVAGANILPGPDGLYSTRDLLKSIHGDIAAEKLRKIELTNEREEIKNAALKRELIPAKEA